MKKTSLTFGVLLFVLAACGQKGPLYLPQPAKPSPDTPKAAPAKPVLESRQMSSASSSTPVNP